MTTGYDELQAAASVAEVQLSMMSQKYRELCRMAAEGMAVHAKARNKRAFDKAQMMFEECLRQQPGFNSAYHWADKTIVEP